MKTALYTMIVLLTTAFSAAATAQTIPPYAQNGDNQSPDSIPTAIDRDKDLPGRQGCYVAEGGANFYYQSGKYYQTDRTTTTYTDMVDSKGKKYSPWGFRLNPSAEFFLFKNVAIGGTAEFGYDTMGADKRITIGVGPIFSFYIVTQNRLIPYFSIFGMYEHTNDYWASTKSMYWTDQALKGGAKAGAVYMLSRQGGIFLDIRFTYEAHVASTPPVQTQTTQNSWQIQSFMGFKYFIF